MTGILVRRGGDTKDAWTQKKGHGRTWPEGSHPQTKERSPENLNLTLDFQPSELGGNKCLLLKSPLPVVF